MTKCRGAGEKRGGRTGEEDRRGGQGKRGEVGKRERRGGRQGRGKERREVGKEGGGEG